MRRLPIVALALLPAVLLVAGCGGSGDGGSNAPTGPIEGALPPDFPADFPLYPDLNVIQSSPLGGRYIIEGESDDSIGEVLAFYERELDQGRWELLDSLESPELRSTTLRFTVPGFELDGRVLVAEGGEEGPRTVIGIAIPLDTGEGE